MWYEDGHRSCVADLAHATVPPYIIYVPLDDHLPPLHAP